MSVMTVVEQGLRSGTDEELFDTCSAEGRTLVTAIVISPRSRKFPPEKSAGIGVLDVGPITTFKGSFADYGTS
jgi:hypothetical protein